MRQYFGNSLEACGEKGGWENKTGFLEERKKERILRKRQIKISSLSDEVERL